MRNIQIILKCKIPSVIDAIEFPKMLKYYLEKNQNNSCQQECFIFVREKNEKLYTIEV